MRLTGFEAITRSNVALGSHTTFRIGGPADALAAPRTIQELCAAVAACRQVGLPLYMLGRGSNLLISDDGVRGLVVLTRKLNRIERRGTRIVAEAGVALPRLVSLACTWGLSGLEPLAGIPGTVGGAVAMNAGGRHGTIGPLVGQVTVVGPDGTLRTLDRRELWFGNRDSSLKDRVIAEAEFELSPSPCGTIWDRCNGILADKKRTQPMSAHSAGCVFRNPPGQSAGALIDQAKLKSQRIGDARVSAKHANFIVNDGRAQARQVRALIELVRARVAEQFDVHLETEVEMWGFEEPRRALSARPRSESL